MNRFLWVCLCGTVFFAGCKKSAGGTTRLLVHNASFATTDLSVLWGGASVTPSALAQGQTTGTAAAPYVSLPAGTTSIVLKSGATVLLDKNIYGAAAGNSSVLVYNGSAASSSLSVVLMTDDLTLPDTAYAQYRVINCVPDTAVDIILRNATDTITVSGDAFIGTTTAGSSLQTFATIKHGTYKPLIYKAGTTTSLLSADSVVLGSQKAYSLIYSGLSTASGTGKLKLSLIYHPVD
jgi:hypothetical protein